MTGIGVFLLVVLVILYLRDEYPGAVTCVLCRAGVLPTFLRRRAFKSTLDFFRELGDGPSYGLREFLAEAGVIEGTPDEARIAELLGDGDVREHLLELGLPATALDRLVQKQMTAASVLDEMRPRPASPSQAANPNEMPVVYQRVASFFWRAGGLAVGRTDARRYETLIKSETFCQRLLMLGVQEDELDVDDLGAIVAARVDTVTTLADLAGSLPDPLGRYEPRDIVEKVSGSPELVSLYCSFFPDHVVKGETDRAVRTGRTQSLPETHSSFGVAIQEVLELGRVGMVRLSSDAQRRLAGLRGVLGCFEPLTLKGIPTDVTLEIARMVGALPHGYLRVPIIYHSDSDDLSTPNNLSTRTIVVPYPAVLALLIADGEKAQRGYLDSWRTKTPVPRWVTVAGTALARARRCIEKANRGQVSQPIGGGGGFGVMDSEFIEIHRFVRERFFAYRVLLGLRHSMQDGASQDVNNTPGRERDPTPGAVPLDLAIETLLEDLLGPLMSARLTESLAARVEPATRSRQAAVARRQP